MTQPVVNEDIYRSHEHVGYILQHMCDNFDDLASTTWDEFEEAWFASEAVVNKEWELTNPSPIDVTDVEYLCELMAKHMLPGWKDGLLAAFVEFAAICTVSYAAWYLAKQIGVL